MEELKNLKFKEFNDEELFEDKKELKRKIFFLKEKILNERKKMKRKIIFSLSISLLLIFVLLLSLVIIPWFRIVQAENIAKEVIKYNFGDNTKIRDVSLKSNGLVIVTLLDKQIIIDTSQKKIIKYIAPEKIDLTDKEKERAKEILMNDEILKKFPISLCVDVKLNETLNDEDKKNSVFYQLKVIDLRGNIEIANIEGFGFKESDEKTARIEIKSKIFPEGTRVFVFVDLKRNKIAGAGTVNNNGEVIGPIQIIEYP